MCCFSLSVWQMCESGHTRTDFSNDQLKTEINVLLLQSFFFDLVRKKHLVSFEKKRSRGSPQGRQLWWVIATSPFGGTFPSGVTSQTCERERGKSNRKKRTKRNSRTYGSCRTRTRCPKNDLVSDYSTEEDFFIWIQFDGLIKTTSSRSDSGFSSTYSLPFPLCG